MLDFLFILSYALMLLATFFGIFNFKDKFSKNMCIIAAFILVVTIVIALTTHPKATKEPEISNIEISEVYLNGENEYCVKLKQSDMLFKVKTEKVYKGDSNYLICVQYPNMSKAHEFLLDTEKTEYFLVVTNLNIPVLDSLD